MSATEILHEDVKELIDHAGDKALRMVKAMLEADQEEQREEDMEDEDWDDLPEQLQIMINEAVKQFDEGRGIPHEEVMKKYPQWFKK